MSGSPGVRRLLLRGRGGGGRGGCRSRGLGRFLVLLDLLGGGGCCVSGGLGVLRGERETRGSDDERKAEKAGYDVFHGCMFPFPRRSCFAFTN